MVMIGNTPAKELVQRFMRQAPEQLNIPEPITQIGRSPEEIEQSKRHRRKYRRHWVAADRRRECLHKVNCRRLWIVGWTTGDWTPLALYRVQCGKASV